MVTVGELLRGTVVNEFGSDVQLDQYWTARNLELLKQYIFTSVAPTGKKSSVELLRTFCEALSPGARENRFVVIATYGHGKSHFALALANFFGKESSTPEAQAVLGAVHHAVADADQAVAGYIDDFKLHHSPYLIVILRG